MGVGKVIGIVAVLAGITLIVVAAVVGWVAVPKIVDSKIKEETRLIPDSETWDKWSDIKIPMRLKFYIYNITNPDALEGTRGNRTLYEKIQLEEKGPYVYTEYRHKVDIKMVDGEEELIYRQQIYYSFNEEESTGSEEDLFNIPNIPMISVATVGESTKTFPAINDVRILMLNLVNNVNEKFVLRNLKVRQILFDGWALNPMFKLIPPHDFPPDFGDIANPTFGLYKGKNGADDGEYRIKTGLNNDQEFGKIVSWRQPGVSEQQQTELNWWYAKDTNFTDEIEDRTYCNMINGSDGSVFPPFNDKESVLRLFQSDVCRSLHLTYSEEVEYRDIPGYRFTLPENLFAAPEINPDNDCFCPRVSHLDNEPVVEECVPGVIRIFPCKNHAPIVTSNPHFLYADDSLFDVIDTEPADVTKHMTYIDIEPDSGMLLRASKKVQINVELQPFPLMTGFQDFNFTRLTDAKSILIPVMWADETAELDHTSAKALYDKLLKPQKLVNVLRWVGIGLGAFILLVGGLLVWKS